MYISSDSLPVSINLKTKIKSTMVEAKPEDKQEDICDRIAREVKEWEAKRQAEEEHKKLHAKEIA